jgi:hypothetical protein
MRVFSNDSPKVSNRRDYGVDDAVRREPVSVVKFPDHQGRYREFL